MGPPLRSRPRAGAWRSGRAACSGSGSGSGSDAWALSDDEGAQVAPATRSPRPPGLLRPLEAPVPSLHPGAVWEIGGGDEARGVATPWTAAAARAGGARASEAQARRPQSGGQRGAAPTAAARRAARRAAEALCALPEGRTPHRCASLDGCCQPVSAWALTPLPRCRCPARPRGGGRDLGLEKPACARGRTEIQIRATALTWPRALLNACRILHSCCAHLGIFPQKRRRCSLLGVYMTDGVTNSHTAAMLWSPLP